jgi:hypothetical protein
MNWFDGPIADAIAKCKTEKLIFMVYVYGKFLEIFH